MRKTREDENLTKHTLHLFEGDMKKLQDLYPDVGAAAVIRKLVRSHIDKITPELRNIKVKVDI